MPVYRYHQRHQRQTVKQNNLLLLKKT
jgi:hypothetical protein